MSGATLGLVLARDFTQPHHAIKIQTYRNAQFGRACTGGRAQDWVPQASGPFVGPDQGRHRDQQRHGTKGDGWVAQNPYCNRVPKSLIHRTRECRFSLPKTNWLWAVRAIPRHPYLSPCPDGELQDDSSLRDRNPRVGYQSYRVPTLAREVILLKA